jgi:hypothetical protein
MSLTILSEKFESQECTFKNVAYASLISKLNFYTLDISLKENESIEIWVRRQFGNGEYDYDFFSMDIHNQKWVESSLFTFTFKGKDYFPLAGTDNTPSRLCYEFSLAYLRVNPKHKIAIYDDCIFGLDEIEAIHKKHGYVADWTRLV